MRTVKAKLAKAAIDPETLKDFYKDCNGKKVQVVVMRKGSILAVVKGKMTVQEGSFAFHCKGSNEQEAANPYPKPTTTTWGTKGRWDLRFAGDMQYVIYVK